MSAVDAKAINIYMSVTGPYAAQMAANGAATARFGTQAHAGMAKAATGISRFGTIANKVGMVAAVGIAAGLALSAKAAIGFESSFAGVRKTVDTSEAGFRRLADGVRAMALEIPIGVNELNRIMELGGQLGVEESGLLEFTEVVAKLGVTTTMSTETASMGFARLDNIMQLNNSSFEEMGSSIVDLGNNFAATEDEILTFALRIAPAGAAVGMTTDEIMGIATAFTSVGVPAERGGTAIQKTLIKIADAADTGGQSLNVFADTAGMLPDEFAKLFKLDPSAAFAAFVEGLGNVEAAGGSVFTTLDAVGLSNQRVITSLLAMSGAGDVLTDALRLSESAWEDNNALNEEAAKRFETTAAQLELVKNQIVDMGISIGSGLLPVIGDLAKGFSVVIDWIDGLDSGIKSVGLAIAGLTAALWLANAHPIILGLTAVAGAVAYIGHQAQKAEDRVKMLKEVLETGVTTNLQLDQIFGTELVDEWLAIGFSREDISKALIGTEADFARFADQMQAHKNAMRAGDEAGLSIAGVSDVDIELMGAYRNELGGIASEEAALQALRNRAKILGVTNLPGMQEEALATEKARDAVQSLYHARQGLIAQDAPTFIAAEIEGKDLDAVVDALDDYAAGIDDAFTDVADSVNAYLDVWYEFPEEFDAAFDAAMASFDRQITAVGNFETKLGELNLSPAVEALVRQLIPTPAHMEAALGKDDEWWAGVIAWAVSSNARINSIIAEKWKLKVEAIEFTTGAQFALDLNQIAEDMFNDPENTSSLAEIWTGLIDTSLAVAGPGMQDKILSALVAAFSDDGRLRGQVNMTKAMIDELIAKLLELSGDYDVEVTTRFVTEGQPYDPVYGAPVETTQWNTGGGYAGGRSAFGGTNLFNQPVWTGELGPELFVPFSHGTIIPNKDLGGKASNEFNLNIHGSTDTGQDAQTALLAASLIGGM